MTEPEDLSDGNLITLGEIRREFPYFPAWRRLLRKTGQRAGHFDPDLGLSLGDLAIAVGAESALDIGRRLVDEAETIKAVMPAVRRAVWLASHKGDIQSFTFEFEEQLLAGPDDHSDAVEEALKFLKKAASPEENWAAWAVVWATRLRPDAAAYAARNAARTAVRLSVLPWSEWWAERAEERRQTADIISSFPLHFFKGIGNG